MSRALSPRVTGNDIPECVSGVNPDESSRSPRSRIENPTLPRPRPKPRRLRALGRDLERDADARRLFRRGGPARGVGTGLGSILVEDGAPAPRHLGRRRGGDPSSLPLVAGFPKKSARAGRRFAFTPVRPSRPTARKAQEPSGPRGVESSGGRSRRRLGQTGPRRGLFSGPSGASGSDSPPPCRTDERPRPLDRDGRDPRPGTGAGTSPGTAGRPRSPRSSCA